jgi:hypothetical protein
MDSKMGLTVQKIENKVSIHVSLVFVILFSHCFFEN